MASLAATAAASPSFACHPRPAGPRFAPSFSAPLRPRAARPAQAQRKTAHAALQESESSTQRLSTPPSEAGAGAGAGAGAAGAVAAACLGALLTLGLPVLANPPSAFAAPTPATPPPNVRLPPLSTDPKRCERAFVGNTIGQANGVADKLLDLRQCNYAGDKQGLKGKTLSAALMSGAVFDDADMTEVIMSKAYASNASFKGVDFTNGVLDRVIFDGSDLTDVKFNNTVLSGTTFTGSELGGADFEDALIGYVDIQRVCRNDTLSETARQQLGCK